MFEKLTDNKSFLKEEIFLHKLLMCNNKIFQQIIKKTSYWLSIIDLLMKSKSNLFW